MGIFAHRKISTISFYVRRTRRGRLIYCCFYSGLLLAVVFLSTIYLQKIDFGNILHAFSISRPSFRKHDHPEAIVSLLTDDLYLPSILVLGYTLKKFSATLNRDMILLIPHGAINSTRHIRMLEEIGWILMYVKRMSFPGKVPLRFVDGLVKVYAWNLTQYDIVVTLDADSMLVDSIEEPFQHLRMNSSISMLAVYDALEPYLKKPKSDSKFNAGVLFFRPNHHHFNELVRLSTNKEYYDLRFPQQNLLNTCFRNQWSVLPVAFNSLDNLHKWHPMWVHQSKNARIVHFAGDTKPWVVKKNSEAKVRDTDRIWHRFFVSLIRERNWTESDFLGPGTSRNLMVNFKFDELLAITRHGHGSIT